MTTTLDLETLLPHRAPMLLLTRALDYNLDSAQAIVHIREDSRFFDARLGGVPSWVGMEYMAQTIGLWAGFQQLSHHKPVQAGFLLGCRRYNCHCAVFTPDSELLIHATIVYREDSGLGAFDCTISHNQEILASAQIKAFRPENPRDFVRPFSMKNSTGTPV